MPPPRRGYSWEFLVGVCCADLQILTLFQTKQYYFSHAFCGLGCKIHTRFQTWLLRNYVIITWIRTPTKTILKIHFGHGWWAPVDLELKRQIGSFSPVVPSKSMPDSRPKWRPKFISVFRPKQRKNPANGEAHTYMACCTSLAHRQRKFSQVSKK